MRVKMSVLAVVLLVLWMVVLPKEAAAVCSTEERQAMAMQGMSRGEIDRRCGSGPVMGSVCSTLQGKCRLNSPRPFFSACSCIDNYGRMHPGEVQQY